MFLESLDNREKRFQPTNFVNIYWHCDRSHFQNSLIQWIWGLRYAGTDHSSQKTDDRRDRAWIRLDVYIASDSLNSSTTGDLSTIPNFTGQELQLRTCLHEARSSAGQRSCSHYFVRPLCYLPLKLSAAAFVSLRLQLCMEPLKTWSLKRKMQSFQPTVSALRMKTHISCWKNMHFSVLLCWYLYVLFNTDHTGYSV